MTSAVAKKVKAYDFRRCKKSERSRENRVPRPDSVRHERHEQSVGPRGAADGVFRSHVGRKGLFQLFHFRSVHILAMGQHFLNPFVQARLYSLLLSIEIDKLH
jgi:hypothetical protein